MSPVRPPLVEVRPSPVAGRGVFALRRIRKGTRLLEYTGERISRAEADRRYDDEAAGPDSHVLLFALDRRTVLDGAVGGSDARFINHSCEPNCEAVIEEGRILFRALRTIQPGEELGYDYRLEKPGPRTREVEALYPCRCGAPGCRGTLLAPRGRGRKA
jgi:SET domain-containing protein